MGDTPTVFISYSRADVAWKDRLVRHLRTIMRQGSLDLWDDSRIAAGEDWKSAIDRAMGEARIAILLITADFLSSDFVFNEEVPRLLQRKQREGLRIFPVLVKPCAWESIDWLSAIQIFPSGRAICKGSEHDIEEDLAAIAREVRRALLNGRSPAKGTMPPAKPESFSKGKWILIVSGIWVVVGLAITAINYARQLPANFRDQCYNGDASSCITYSNMIRDSDPRGSSKAAREACKLEPYKWCEGGMCKGLGEPCGKSTECCGSAVFCKNEVCSAKY
jgi:hypothetical protein